jgi:hypothetical protein
MTNSTILFLVIEGDNNKGCGGSGGEGQNQARKLENECELFLSRWYSESLNHEFSKIETYLICSSNNPPSSLFLNKIEKEYPLVRYVHCPHEISDTFPAGWFNTPLAGKWLEENVEFDKAIHLDLDMILLKKFNQGHLELKDGAIANCATYHPDFPDDMAAMDGIEKRFVTCFVISSKSGKFYSKWWDTQSSLQKQYIQKYGKELVPANKELWWRYCNLEEHAVDRIFFEHGEKIEEIQYCQFGAGSGYGSIEQNVDHIEKINFLHCHVDSNWREQISDWAKLNLKKHKRA